ncbi:unnamed protein product [Mytilus edulis]|uniref:Ion transport domain-containing protein n=1 Tax=Mytilus edulis TaxID=6550 RepID=A0A8S3VFB9_MYTED|nr:unnamed protein product [Mytilus edulis]
MTRKIKIRKQSTMYRKDSSSCTNNEVLYRNGTFDRCPEVNQINTVVLAVYMVLSHIILVNILIAMFSNTFTKVQDNNELVWKFHRYSLIQEYNDRSALLPPLIIISYLNRTLRYIFKVYKKKKKEKKNTGNELGISLSPLLANILPAVHALTGCDTTSAIFGFGKKTVFKLIRKSPSKFTNLQNFDKIDFSTSLSAARELISSLYDPKDKFASSHVDLNKLRVKLATCKDTSLLRLPPSEPAFNEHVLRLEASYEEHEEYQEPTMQDQFDSLSSEVDIIQRNQEETLEEVEKIMAETKNIQEAIQQIKETKDKLVLVEVPKGTQGRSEGTYCPVEVEVPTWPFRETIFVKRYYDI